MGITGRLQMQAEASTPGATSEGIWEPSLAPKWSSSYFSACHSSDESGHRGRLVSLDASFRNVARTAAGAVCPALSCQDCGQDHGLSSCPPNPAQVEISRLPHSFAPGRAWLSFPQGNRSISLLSALLSMACFVCQGGS